MHRKRQSAPKQWPIARKGTAFVVSPKSNSRSGIPLLVAIRDVLGEAKTRNEVKKAINSRNILINNKPARSEKDSLTILDNLTLVPSKKIYQVILSEKGKFSFEEMKGKESDFKTVKIIGKKVLPGKKMQINLSDGRNVFYTGACKLNDSLLINLKTGKVEKTIPLKEKGNVLVIGGKHAGKKGQITSIDSDKKVVEILNNDSKINVLIKQIVVIE